MYGAARTFVTLTKAPLGYQPDRVLTLRAQLAFRKFPNRDAMLAFYQRTVGAVAELPGVERASVMSQTMFRDIVTYRRVALDGDQQEVATTSSTVFPDFFRTMGIAMREGREVAVDDKDHA